MGEQLCKLGEIELCYEEFGAPDGDPLLLIMGLGAQMVAWPERFCKMLVDQGHRVIRFDNRDIGHSTTFEALPTPRLSDVLAGRKRAASYSLQDMAADEVGLLDHLGIDKAHVVGASMGGMIAQTLAIAHPDRVRSLTSIMSTTGRRTVGAPNPRIIRAFLSPPPAGKEEQIEHFVRVFQAIGSRGDLFEADTIRTIVRASLARGMSRSATLRQMAAISTAGDRTNALRQLRVPALVIHGAADPLIHRSGGRATAKAIPGSCYMEFAGMGHDLPSVLWPQMTDAIASLARRAHANSQRTGTAAVSSPSAPS